MDLISDAHRRILIALEDSKPLTYEDLASLTRMSYDGVRGRVAELVDLGYDINRERDGRKTLLSLNKTIRQEDLGEANPDIEHTRTRLRSAQSYNSYRRVINEVKNNTKVIKKPTLKLGNKIAHLLLSDLHFGQKIEIRNKVVFNTEIAHKRLDAIINQAIDVLHKEDMSELIIYLFGDMVDGDQIYKTHPFEVEMIASKQVYEASMALSRAINTFLDEGIKLTIHCVRGNHGQVSYQTVYEDNWDNMVYSHLEIKYAENRDVRIYHYLEDEAKIELPQRNVLMYHGNGFPNQIATASGLRDFRGIFSKHHLTEGDMVFFGHWHNFGVEQDHNVVLVRNGGLPDTNDYAWKKHFFSKPSQTLVITEEGKVYPQIHTLEA